MSRKHVIAIDQSTSATKACLFTATAEVRHRVTLPHNTYYPQPGWVEQDARELVEKCRTAIEKLVLDSRVPPADIVGLAITNQRETIVAWDEVTGDPVYRALVWQDERGHDFCSSIAESDAGLDVVERTGLVVDTYFSASKLKWLVENVPECSRAVAEGRLLAGTIDTWLIWNFTGGVVFATDYSNACRTLLFNIQTLSWDETLLKLFKLDSVKLPEVRYSDATFGMYRFAHTDTEIPIVGVMGDSHAALYGQGGWSPGDAKTTFGTGSSIMMNIGTTNRKAPTGVVTSLAWGIGGHVTYVYEGNIHATGDTIKWVRDQLGMFTTYEEAEQRAQALQENGGVHLVPAFSGLGSPYWQHGVRAAIVGMSRGSKADHVIRAALESIAFQVSDVIRTMTDDTQTTFSTLRVDGGPTVNRFLMQFLADLLGMPVLVAEIEEVSARGVAFVAGLSEGLWSDEADVLSTINPTATYVPSITEGRRRVLLEGWGQAVRQVLAGVVDGN